jgi:hypothetical protein
MLKISLFYFIVIFFFSFQRIAIEISRSNMTATRAGGGNGLENSTNPGTLTSVISPVVGDSGLHSCVLEPSVVAGSLPVRLVG